MEVGGSVLSGSLETGTKGPNEQRQRGEYGCQTVRTCRYQILGTLPPWPREGTSDSFSYESALVWHCPKALKEVLSLPCSLAGGMAYL